MSIRENADALTKLQIGLLELKAEVVGLQANVESTRKNQSIAVRALIGDLDRPWGDMEAHTSIILARIERLLGENED